MARCFLMRVLVLAVVFASLSSTGAAHAAEGGMGLYPLGYVAPQAGYLPPPGTYAKYDLYTYLARAKVAANRPVLGGHGTIDASASFELQIFANIFSLMHVFEPTILGAKAGVAVAIPYVLADLGVSSTGTITLPNQVIPIGGQREFDEVNLGDTTLTGLLGWHRERWHYMALLNLYVPTGRYDANAIVNTGKNHWAVEPMAALTYLNTTNGIELSGAAGLTVNTVNPDTSYLTGLESHLDLAAIQHLSERFYLGAVGYAYYQVSGDSGSGAALGDFKGRVFGAGPVIGGMLPIGDHHKVFTNLRYYREWGARNRLEGDTIFFTAAVNF